MIVFLLCYYSIVLLLEWRIQAKKKQIEQYDEQQTILETKSNEELPLEDFMETVENDFQNNPLMSAFSREKEDTSTTRSSTLTIVKTLKEKSV